MLKICIEAPLASIIDILYFSTTSATAAVIVDYSPKIKSTLSSKINFLVKSLAVFVSDLSS